MLCWLLLGFVLVFHGGYGDRIDVWICYDIMLGVLGIATAYTAASDFKIAHSGPHIRNKASGVLDEDATVTYSEMIEHVFYQILNYLYLGMLGIVLRTLSFSKPSTYLPGIMFKPFLDQLEVVFCKYFHHLLATINEVF